MVIVVTGASGLLGRQIFAEFERKYPGSVVGTAFSRCSEKLRKVDLTNDAEVEELFESLRPSVVVHSAAERRPDVAEKDPEGSLKLNVAASRKLGELCKQYNSYLLYISTDYVFDGTKPPYEVDDAPNPLNFYGKSKLAGEMAIREVCDTAAFLRVPVLYGEVEYNSESAVNILIDVIKNTSSGKMDDYQVRYPTNTSDVARVCRELAERATLASGEFDHSFSGIYHFSAKQRMTKYEMCVSLAKILNMSTDHITPVGESEQTTSASVSRPHNAQLATSRLEKQGIDVSYVDFEDWFRQYLN